MMQRNYLTLIVEIAFIATFAVVSFADVPAPPVNQTIGVPDGIFNDMVESECRLCHEDPSIISGDAHIPNRHHLLMNSPIQTGECSVIHTDCLLDSECNPGICSRNYVPCMVDTDCPQFFSGETCGENCIGETVAPDKDSDRNSVDDTVYQCLNCHLVDTTGGIIQLLVWRDCLLCHVQIPGEASVHHLTATAQGTNSPIGAPNIGDCTPCHGTLVDDIGDGHEIPLYAPSLVTPAPSEGNGLPINVYENSAGACDYCHDQDTMPPAAPIEIYRNADTHHNTGVYINEVGAANNNACLWCHLVTIPPQDPALRIRVCEGCHGYESLHNIQVDSDGDTIIDIGGELAGFGHIGNNDDCWGCHGFLQSDVGPGTGPITPFIGSSDVLVVTSGTDTVMTLAGSAFTNTYFGLENWTSIVRLTAADGSTTDLVPDSISENLITVTIPGAVTPGNYDLRAVKDNAVSNPIAISVMPAVNITEVKCMKRRGMLIIKGSGFSEKIEGTDAYLNLKVNGEVADIISWRKNRIKVSVSRCSDNDNVTVKTLFGSATTDNAPPKPDTGR
jgi:hypothetical protein